MIHKHSLASIGTITKPHALKGEMNVALDIDAELLSAGDFLMIDTDGIIVPYRIESVRPKNHSALILLEGVNSEEEAKLFSGKTIYIEKEKLAAYGDYDSDPEGDYADDLVGYTIIDEAGDVAGTVRDLELSTSNALFILESPKGKTVYVPVAEEFITGIDHERQVIRMNLPEGLLGLND